MRVVRHGRSVAMGLLLVAAVALPGAASATPPAFLSLSIYTTGSFPESVAIADVNGDGRKDALLTTSNVGPPDAVDYKLFVFAQRADESLAAPTVLATDGASAPYSQPMPIATGDLNGDGRTDAVVGTNYGIGVYIQGAPGLGPKTRIPNTARAD